MRNIKGQGMFSIKKIAEEKERKTGKKLIHLEIGDRSGNAPEEVKKSLISAVKQNKTHYTSSFGLFKLRKAIAEKHTCDVDNVFVCPANFGIFASLAAITEQGDSVYWKKPAFPSYEAARSFLNLEYSYLNPKVIINNSPRNPDGRIENDIEAKEWLINDNAYEGMVWEEIWENQRYDGDRLIEIYSFSKTHSMSGFRLGFVLAPKEVVKRMALVAETTYSCLPEFIQIAGLEALKIERYGFDELEFKKKYLCKELKKLGYEFEKPEGGIYVFIKVNDEEEEFRKLLDAGVVVCHGSIFGKENYIRVCFGKEMKELKEAVKRMKNV